MSKLLNKIDLVPHFVNTREFSHEAYKFLKEGRYTISPRGTYGYKEYWDEQKRRCEDGYSIGGVRITGAHYYYLNFCQILARVKIKGEEKKIYTFPRFLDMDYYYYHELEKARQNGQGMIIAKSRRKGFSYKNASLLTHKYNFFRDSTSIIGAYLSEYADYTMGMGLEMINFVNSNTAWAKRKNPDRSNFVKARFRESVDGVEQWAGYNSQISTLTFKDNKSASIGKCHGAGELILMYDGNYKKIEDITEGDQVMGIDSKPRNVIGTSTGIDQLYKVSQKNGESYTVNSQHPLALKHISSGRINYVSAEEWLKWPKWKQKDYSGIKSKEIEFEKTPVPLDPYFIGLWLGDGTRRKPQITTIDKEIIDYLDYFSKQRGLELKKYKISYYLSSGKKKKNSVVEILKNLHLFTNKAEKAKEKFIPEIYKKNSIVCRRMLLAGLIDSDGSLTKNKKYYEYCSKDVQLADDVVWLCRSLGLKTSIKDKIVNNKIYKRIFITGNLFEIPVKIERKKAPKFTEDKRWHTTKISIAPLKKDRYYGITIDGDHLYLLKDFTITHNTADIFLFEEAGKFPNLIESYMLTAPVFRDGNIMIGMPIIFGTGGDMEGGTQDFSEMFDNPTKYWLRPFDNIWDEGTEGTEAGFFIDDMWYKPGKVYMPFDRLSPESAKRFDIDPPKDGALSDFVEVEMVDDDGNSNREAAEYFLEVERESQKKTGSRKAWEGYITQYPKTPREAFLRISGNLFPVTELNILLGELETSKRAQRSAIVGDLYWNKDGKVKFKENPDLHAITDFPVRDHEDKKGAVVIYEEPYRDDSGDTPFGMYIGGTDPYDQDSSTTNSLGSTFVYKTFQKFDNTYDEIVAEYTGRPETADEYYENVRKLLTYFGAQTLYENNLKGLKIHFEQKKALHLLKEQPAILADIVKDSHVRRGYGVHMTQGIKQQCEIYLRDWLLTKKADGEKEGKELLNLHSIRSIPLIKELIAYNKDGNFDRVIAFMLVILHSQENYYVKVEKTYHKIHNDKFWNKRLFQNKKVGRLNSFR